ncbi:MAG TPA: CheR family methyltransferase [Fimbriimonadaceae bacterium]|jgi:chemotaxis protein methyltransferase CheR
MSIKTEDIEIQLLLEAIYLKYNYDFRKYARASIKRRLTRAKESLRCSSFSMLQDRILHDPAVFPPLLSYLTVQVSEMFRDPEYFKAIREQVIPYLKTFPSLKVWVAGCSHGEEVYSLAILFREEGLEKRTLYYGTDINYQALEIAEKGIYPLDQIALFTENHRRSGGKSSLSDYYTAGYGSAVFDKSLRERIVFSNHSLVSDAVFAEVHLISCRNVLIYFDRDVQDRAVGLFEEALAYRGFLGLGSKETLRHSKYVNSLEDFVKEEKIYRKRDVA